MPREKQNWFVFSLMMQQVYLTLVISCIVSCLGIIPSDFVNPSDVFSTFLSFFFVALVVLMPIYMTYIVLFKLDRLSEEMFCRRN